MRILKNKEFQKWAKKQGIQDETLKKAIQEINHGLYDANLGGGIYKKRLPFGNKGKRSGIRAILAFKIHEIAIFIYGYAKNKIDNLSQKDESALKELAEIYFNFSHDEINRAIKTGQLIEVNYEKINS